MKNLLNLICILVFATSSFAQDLWLNFTRPFPIKAAVPSGEGLLMATSGGVRYRASTADDLYTTSNGLGDQSVSAVIISKDAGVFSVSDNGVISLMMSDGRWVIQSRAYAGSNTHVIPGMALAGGPVLVIAFEDRLSFFSIKTMTSILTIDRIADISISANAVSAMDIRGDSLIVAAGGALYMRKMDWDKLEDDVKLYDPDSWKIIQKASSDKTPIKSIAWKDNEIRTFSTEGMRIWDKDGFTRVALDTFSVFTDTDQMVTVRGKVLKDSALYALDSVVTTVGNKRNVRFIYKSIVRWVSLQPSGQAVLAGPDKVFHYDGKKLTDISDYKSFPLESVYELRALPTGGVLAATDNGRLSYYYFSGDDKDFRWSDPVPIYPPVPAFANGSDARGHNLKVLSVLPTGGAMYHFWGYGFFLYKGWADTLINTFTLSEPGNSYCMDNWHEGTSIESIFTIAVSTTLAPDNMGYLTTSASNKGYSLVYIDIKGESTTMSCASNVGSTPIGGPMYARVSDDGKNWIVYVGTRAGPSLDANGGLDVFTFPLPKSKGGDISWVDSTYRETFSGSSSTPLDLVYEPKSDNVWMVTNSALVYWDKDEKDLKSPLSTNGLSGASYTSIDVDSRGNLWVGTSSQGAYRLTPRKTSPDTLSTIHFTTRHGLLSEKIQDVAVDTVLGMVWFAHENGITRYKRDDLRGTEKNMTNDAPEDVKVYPNPFRPKMQAFVSFANLADDAVVNVYNRGGKLVVSMSGDQISGGRAAWNGRMDNGNIVAPGVYQYVIRGGTKIKKGKLLIIH